MFVRVCMTVTTRSLDYLLIDVGERLKCSVFAVPLLDPRFGFRAPLSLVACPSPQAVQNIVSATEKALKLVSDAIAEEDTPKEDTPRKARGTEGVLRRT